MNNNPTTSSSIAPTALDLQALLATMPDFSLMSSMQNLNKDSRPNAENPIPTSQSLLFPPIPNDQLAALSLGLFPLSGFPMFPLLPMGPMGTTALPPHSTIESLGLMTNLRQSTSGTTLTPQAALDVRPRAFSSAAALQRPKQTNSPERRRKRSRKTQEEENEGSVLRMLMDEEDDTPIKIRQQPTKDLDEKLRMDAAKASVLNASSPPPAKRASPDRLAELIEEPDEPSKTVLRRIIRDEDLPDSIGPDSPFRHHPKYQRKQRGSDAEMIEGMEALTAFCMVNGYVPADSTDDNSSPSPKNNNDSGYTSAGSPKRSFSEMMDIAICRELVTAE
ncbi:unnamed protein product [Cylicocyclus nassatus]|uniref:Uncharacterized protein n=1 Tax=Cylicocyclus nassatus TaxID=53992 RepID=A0AA36DMR7_CYLNA|nr:unnamed protein product [Cylicocyclus nassatus]